MMDLMRTRNKVVRQSLLSVIGVLVWTGAVIAEQRINVLGAGFTDNRSAQFASGAVVYVARIVSVKQVSEDGNIKRFYVELNVEKAILGDGGERVALAGWQHATDAARLKLSGMSSPWDGVAMEAGGRPLLIVVATDGYDPVAGDIEGTKAAFEVHELRAVTDPLVTEFEDIVRIERAKAEEMQKVLAGGMSDARWPVRRFALRTAARKADPDVATTLLSDFLRRPSAKLEKKEIDVTVTSLYNLQRRQDVSPAQRVRSWMALAKLISSENRVVRDAAMRQFRWAVHGQPRPREFDATRGELQSILKPLAEGEPDEEGVREAAGAILRWLDQAAAPLRSAAMSASVVSLPRLPASQPAKADWEFILSKALISYGRKDYKETFDFLKTAINTKEPGPGVHRCLALLRLAFINVYNVPYPVEQWNQPAKVYIRSLQEERAPSDADLVVLAVLLPAKPDDTSAIKTLDVLLDPKRKSKWLDWSCWEKARIIANKASTWSWDEDSPHWGEIYLEKQEDSEVRVLAEHASSLVRYRAALSFLKSHPQTYMREAMTWDIACWRAEQLEAAFRDTIENDYPGADKFRGPSWMPPFIPATSESLKVARQQVKDIVMRQFSKDDMTLAEAYGYVDQFLWTDLDMDFALAMRGLKLIVEVKGEKAFPPEVVKWLYGAEKDWQAVNLVLDQTK